MAGALGTILSPTVIGYIDRGDPSDFDKVLADFTTDGTWRDLDLSAIVPAGATAILLSVIIQDDAVNSQFNLRKNGNTNAKNASPTRTQVANVYHDQTIIVACDTNRVVEYFAENTTWNFIYITVKGWFI